MPIVKHWKISKWRSWPVNFSHPNNRILPYIPAMIFSACLGTLSDYILITQGLYSFPLRPFPAMFDVNIFFTLFILPAATFVFLIYAGRVSFTQRLIMIIVIGAIMPEMEAMSEKWGWFVHSEDWTHIYSFFGYIVYLWVIWTFHRWVTQLRLSVK